MNSKKDIFRITLTTCKNVTKWLSLWLQSNEKFLKWYEEHVNNDYIFYFHKELIEHCKSNVDILPRSMMKFREDFMKLENIEFVCLLIDQIICLTKQSLLYQNM